MLILDSGDLFFAAAAAPPHLKQQWQMQAEFIVDRLNEIGCDAVGVGETDFALGKVALLALKQRAKFPLINANIVDEASAEPLFTPYVIKQIGPLRIGIFSVIDHTLSLPKGLKAIDSVKTAQKMVRKLASKVDFIVALTHQGLGKDMHLALKVSGIDFVVGGHDAARLSQPKAMNETLIVQAHEKGKYAGILELMVREGFHQYQPIQTKFEDVTQFRTNLYRHYLVALDTETFQNGDPDVFQKVQAFKEELSALALKTPEGEALSAGTKTAQGNVISFATYRQCKECHASQYEVWKRSKHATAMIPLYIRNQHLNAECVQCHSVGFRQPGGFSNAAFPFVMDNGQRASVEAFLEKLAQKGAKVLPEQLRQKKLKGSMMDLRDYPDFDRWVRAEYVKAMEQQKWQKDFLGIQCESCHAPRGVNNPEGKQVPHFNETGFPKKVVANSCLECHTAEQSPNFRFARDRHVQGEKDAHPPFQCKLGVF